MGAAERPEAAFVSELFRRFFWPPEDLTVYEWAESKLYLPREMSAEPGPIRLDRTPYLRQIFADLNNPHVDEIVLMFATQLGKTTALLALLGYVVDHDPAPVMMVLPTIDVAKKFSKQRIAPLIEANKCLRDAIPVARSRDSENTLLVKAFPGGMLVITGANSPSGLASMPAKVLLFDEVDDYPEDAGGQGEPTRIATARQDTFARRLRIKSSTPKRPKGRSMIEADFERGTRFRYYVPCPHCGAMQTLRWPRLLFDEATVAYTCEGCAALIFEPSKTGMLAAGEWRAENPEARSRSYHLNSLYSPLGWLSWQTLVREWETAGERAEFGDHAPRRTFINTRLAETWEEQSERIAATDLEEAAEDYRLGTVPEPVKLLVAFVDVQDNRFEVGVWGFGPDDDMYTVAHLVIPADPGLDADWDKVDAALQTKYDGLEITAAAIDTGGHYTHEVYRFVRKIPARRKVAATKGYDRPGMPILGRASAVDVNWKGGVIKNGVKLWSVGVNAAKDLLFARIVAGRVHTSKDLPADWFKQMTAEHRIEKRTARGVRYVWVKRAGGVRNEALDIAAGAIWCMERLGASRWPKGYWARIGKRKPAETPAVDDTPPVNAPKKTAWIPPRPRGFVTNWR